MVLLCKRFFFSQKHPQIINVQIYKLQHKHKDHFSKSSKKSSFIPKSLTTFWNSSSRTLGKLDSVNNGLQNIRPCWLKSTKYKTEIHFLLCSQHTEECLAGAPATSEEDTFKWRVPFRLPKTIHNFEVRLGPPGGDKVRQSVSKTYDWHDYDLPGLQSDHWSGPSLHRNVLVDQWTAAAWAHRG